MLTKQEVFDKVMERFLDHTGRAVDERFFCMYKTEDGNKCAVGIFIPDGHDAQDFNGPVEELIEKFPTSLPEEIYAYEDMMCKFQEVHDDLMSWDENEFTLGGCGKMKRLAEENGLEYKY